MDHKTTGGTPCSLLEKLLQGKVLESVPHIAACPSSISRLGRKSLTLARLLAILRAMRDVFRRVAVLRFSLSTRRDLLLEILALRHQLGILGRSDRRFRPSDRQLWVCLRRLWPRWREALVLVQPATVARWQREGFRGCWRHRSRRRPGRPRIDLQLRSLIGRMATENWLWGAPRIHGELLKLGFTVSERTVSRYLPHRLTTPSQTWRTFLANHIGTLAFAWTVTSSFTTSDDDVDALVLRCRPLPPSRDGRLRFKSAGIGRFASFAPINVSRLACRTPSASPPHTFQHWQGPADLVGRQSVLAAYGSWFPALKKSISANELIRGRRTFDSESMVAIGKLWLALRAIRSSTRLVSRHCLRSWY